MEPEERHTLERAFTAPEPEDPRKPVWPWELTARSWRHVFRRTLIGVADIVDAAGTLTYFSVLSIFPALLAIVSTLTVFGQGDATVEWILQFLASIHTPEVVLDLLADPIRHLTQVTGAGWVLLVSLGVALFSASSYVAAFGRAMNRVYDVVEGRPLWKIIPYNLLVTLAILAFGVLVMATILTSGGLVFQLGAYVGIGAETLAWWQRTRWVILAASALPFLVALYHATPNVRQPRLRWTVMGAILALGALVLAAIGFSTWVSAFGLLNATYGIIGSFIIMLLGLWLMNAALLMGAEFNAEVERVRQLLAGLDADVEIQLPPRDTRAIRARARRDERLHAEARQIRAAHAPERPDTKQDAQAQDPTPDAGPPAR